MRGNAFDLVSLPGGPDSASQQPTSVSMISSHYWLSDTRTSSPLRINTEVDGVLSANQREMSVGADLQSGTQVLFPSALCESPISRLKCDGWCGYDWTPRATVVSGHSVAVCE